MKQHCHSCGTEIKKRPHHLMQLFCNEKCRRDMRQHNVKDKAILETRRRILLLEKEVLDIQKYNLILKEGTGLRGLSGHR